MKSRTPETRLAGVMAPAVGMLLLMATVFTPTLAAAKPASDPEGDFIDAEDANFDIKTYGVRDDGMLFVQVYGKAARTLPTVEHQGFAYVFFTDDGIWAINGHQEAHSTDLPQWHAERIIVKTIEYQGQERTCVESIDVASERPLIIAGTNVMVKGTGVTEISAVLTLEFHLLVDEPDGDPDPETGCIGLVELVFDEA